MGKTLHKVHAACVGRIPNCDKVPQWLRANGGQYSKTIDQNLTHLITTKEAYKNNVEAVQTAERLWGIKIVSYEWLEDSLMSKSRAPKREGPYLWKNILKVENKPGKADGVKKGAKREAKVTKRRKINVNATDYHIYSPTDTGRNFSVTLARYLPSKTSREKFHLELYESNSKPHVYTAHARYSRIGKSYTEILAPRGSTLDVASSAFEQFFETKSGKKWENRLDGTAPPLKTDDNGNILALHEGWFSYDNAPTLLSVFLRQEQESGVDGSNHSENPQGPSDS
ncbi:hypothetical protein FE257_002259 [Aspergillus nanangensis]|uniref:BRCT domain protein n=1 Tax=Aspergillus nanangensis TaxID=2582783 RepID=A0AAD4CD82_ASPNN|nr:hypothetical protein FE257_002259 [Aspergillus nanangensis]